MKYMRMEAPKNSSPSCFFMFLMSKIGLENH